jgi:hypothetical protein
MIKSKLFLGALLGCAGAFCASTAGAQQLNIAEFKPRVWINAGLRSYHFDRQKDYRESNWGLGGEYVFKPNHVAMIGTFINSENHRSRYVGYQWRPLHWQPYGVNVSAGVSVSAINGYPSMSDKGWFIAPMPMISVEYKNFGANFILVPNVKHGGAVAVQLKLAVW